MADLFADGTVVNGWCFGLEVVANPKAVRAFISKEGSTDRYYIVLFWQEDFTSNPFARSKYIKGKFVYQKEPAKNEFFARQYEVHDGKAHIADIEEASSASIMPSEEIKTLWALDLAGQAFN